MSIEIGAITDSLALRGRMIQLLCQKTFEELSDVKQFTNPQRRLALWRHGLSYLGALRQSISDSTLLTEQQIESLSKWYRLSSGIDIGVIREWCMSATLLPEGTVVSYNHPKRNDKREDGIDVLILGPTHKYIHSDDSYYPSEGYRDSNRVVVPFAKRDKSSRIQHGGIMVDNQVGKFTILNYEDLSAMKSLHLRKSQVLMEACWYMDSENQNIVSDRPNLQIPKMFNCLGILSGPDKIQRYFALSLNWRSFELVPEVDVQPKCEMHIPLRTVAAFSNVLARRFGAQSWATAGLEYIGGGVYAGQDAPYIDNWRDLFAFSVPKNL